MKGMESAEVTAFCHFTHFDFECVWICRNSMQIDDRFSTNGLDTIVNLNWLSIVFRPCNNLHIDVFCFKLCQIYQDNNKVTTPSN